MGFMAHHSLRVRFDAAAHSRYVCMHGETKCKLGFINVFSAVMHDVIYVEKIRQMVRAEDIAK